MTKLISEHPGYLVATKDLRTLFDHTDYKSTFDDIDVTITSMAYGNSAVEAIELCDIDNAICILDSGNYTDDVADIWNIASKLGCVVILVWLHENGFDGKCTTDAMNCAAFNGNICSLMFLHETGHGCTTDAMDCAAMNGHLDILKWLHKYRTEGCTDQAMCWAASNGYFDIVKWLYKHRPGEYDIERALKDAISSRHTDIAKWLRKRM